MNGAYDSIDLFSKLLALHTAGQDNPNEEKYAKLKYSGLDLEKGGVRNSLDSGVLEPLLSKTKQIKFATEAAISILRIDEMIKIAP